MKVCFVSSPIIDVLISNRDVQSIGGAELQQVFIGQGLKKKGFDVSYVTRKYKNPADQMINGMTIYKTFNVEEGFWGLRYFYPRLYKVWKALKRADADIYYTRCAGHLVGIVALFCRLYKRKFIYAAAHDTDFVPQKIRLKSRRDKILYLYGLRKASAIVVQSNHQERLLWNNFKRTGVIIRSFHPFNSNGNQLKKEFVLWVATIRSWKRPLQLIKLAKAFPDEKFIMIGGLPKYPKPIERALYQALVDESEKIKNLKFLGFLPFDITERYFDRAKVFISTSSHEGFPNTFLQAWRRGIKIISYVDPDNVISQNKLGCVVGNEMELEFALQAALENSQKNSEAYIKKYYDQNHSIKNIERYCSLLNNLRQ